MAAKDYYFNEEVKCTCGHHIHARKDEDWELCDCSQFEHSLICPVQIAFDKE